MRSRAWRSLDLLLALSIFGAAMFTEPAVTEIEEMIGLIHGKKGVGGWVLGVGRVLQHPTPYNLHPTPYTHSLIGAVYPAFLSDEPARKCDDHCVQFVLEPVRPSHAC
jgi:hypothetical protein